MKKPSKHWRGSEKILCKTDHKCGKLQKYDYAESNLQPWNRKYRTFQCKMICRAFDNDPQRMMQATVEELVDIQGVGEVIARTFVDYFSDETHRDLFKRLLQEVKLQKEEGEESAQIFENMNFVITGSVEHFANRREVKEIIESRGGKVTGSVTGKTNYLINNDVQSASSKNKKAKELNVPIISESQFLEMLETGTV